MSVKIVSNVFFETGWLGETSIVYRCPGCKEELTSTTEVLTQGDQCPSCNQSIVFDSSVKSRLEEKKEKELKRKIKKEEKKLLQAKEKKELGEKQKKQRFADKLQRQKKREADKRKRAEQKVIADQNKLERELLSQEKRERSKRIEKKGWRVCAGILITLILFCGIYALVAELGLIQSSQKKVPLATPKKPKNSSLVVDKPVPVLKKTLVAKDKSLSRDLNTPIPLGDPHKEGLRQKNDRENDLPTAELTGLTPEAVKLIVQRQNGSDSYPRVKNSLDLSELLSIDIATAKELSKFEGKLLKVPFVTKLDPAVAQSLAKARCFGIEIGIDSVDEEVLQPFKNSKLKALIFTGITSLTEQEAAILAGLAGDESNRNSFSGSLGDEHSSDLKPGLNLPLITELTGNVLATLMKSRWQAIYLDNVTAIDDTDTSFFKRIDPDSRHVQYLSLNKLKAISPQLASEFGRIGLDWLNLDGVTSLSKDSAEALSYSYNEQHGCGTVSLNSLTNTDNTKFLKTGTLFLNSVDSIPSNYLYKIDASTLHLNGVKRVTPAHFQRGNDGMDYNVRDLNLNGLESINDKTLEAIFDQRGFFNNEYNHTSLSLNGLKKLPSGTKKIIDKIFSDNASGVNRYPVSIGYEVTTFSLNGIREYDENVKYLLEHFNGDINLSGLRSIGKYPAREIQSWACYRNKQKRIASNNLVHLDSLGYIRRNDFEFIENCSQVSAPNIWTLPPNEKKITKLSVEAAEELVENYQEVFSLTELKSLTSDVAAVLAKARCEKLILGVEDLDIPSAQSLSRSTIETLCLNQLTSFRDGVSYALLGGRKGLSFTSTGYEGKLEIPRIEFLSLDDVKALGGTEKILSSPLLSQLRRIDERLANALVEATQGQKLSLLNVESLSSPTAEALAKHKGALNLPSLEALSSVNLARKLTEQDGITLERLKKTTADVVSVLASKSTENLDLSGLSSLSEQCAEQLVQFKGSGYLNLSGIDRINAKIAGYLSKCKCNEIRLNGLTTLSDNVAEKIVEFEGETISLAGITSLDPVTVTLLIGNSKIKIPPLKKVDFDTNCLQSIPADVAAELASSRYSLSLNGLKDIDLNIAQAISRGVVHKLELDGIAALDSRVAAELIPKVQSISLQGLTAVKGDILADYLAKETHSLDLSRVKIIDLEALNALLRSNAININLSGLKSLSDPEIDILARHLMYQPDSIFLAGELKANVGARIKSLERKKYFENITSRILRYLVLIVIAAILLGFYFLPSIIAINKKRHNREAIVVLNLLGGWTFFGWVIALVWAVSE